MYISSYQVWRFSEGLLHKDQLSLYNVPGAGIEVPA